MDVSEPEELSAPSPQRCAANLSSQLSAGCVQGVDFQFFLFSDDSTCTFDRERCDLPGRCTANCGGGVTGYSFSLLIGCANQLIREIETHELRPATRVGSRPGFCWTGGRRSKLFWGDRAHLLHHVASALAHRSWLLMGSAAIPCR